MLEYPKKSGASGINNLGSRQVSNGLTVPTPSIWFNLEGYLYQKWLIYHDSSSWQYFVIRITVVLWIWPTVECFVLKPNWKNEIFTNGNIDVTNLCHVIRTRPTPTVEPCLDNMENFQRKRKIKNGTFFHSHHTRMYVYIQMNMKIDKNYLSHWTNSILTYIEGLVEYLTQNVYIVHSTTQSSL